jgi:UPF0716 protein FxsA
MRFVVLAILLAFPAIDLLATVRFARWTGVPLWMWLAFSTTAGFVLLRSERGAFRANTAAAMHGQQLALRGLFDSGRKVLAGVLLILPGVVSDLMALVLLALPLNVGNGHGPRAAHPRGRSRADPFDGEFRRLD